MQNKYIINVARKVCISKENSSFVHFFSVECPDTDYSMYEVYTIAETLKEKFPECIIEVCRCTVTNNEWCKVDEFLKNKK